MSNHFRFCPKHKKSLPCPHCAIAPVPGGPTEPPREPIVAAARKKLGRPAKNGVSMTAAQRQAVSRANKAAKPDDKERRDIVAKLMKMYRYAALVPTEKAPDKIRENIHAQRRKLNKDLLALNLEQVRDVLRIWRESNDLKGRLPGERSGEKERKYGMSELERIIAARTNGRPRTSKTLSDYDNEKAGLRRPSGGRGIPPEHLAYLDEREAVITELIEKYYCRVPYIRKQSRPDGVVQTRFEAGQCRLCGEFPNPGDVRQHFWREYDKGLEARDRYQELNEPGVVELAPFIVSEAEDRVFQNKHLVAVWDLVRKRSEQRRQASRKAGLS